MVAGVAMRIAAIGARGLFNAGKALVTSGAKLPGGIVGQKAIEYGLVVPALGSAAMSLGLPFGAPKPQPGMAPQGVPGMGMTPSQQQFLYGQQGFNWPWESQQGFLDRQLNQQRDMFMEGQRTLRLNNQNNYSLGMAGLSNQYRVADMMSNRQLQGIQDTNSTRVQLADRELAGLYDTNRTRVRMADIGSRTSMYQADRAVEIARWSGAPARIATFGALMR